MTSSPAPISLGHDRTGTDAFLDLPELLATRLLVQGNSGSGKSHLLRRLLEQTARLVQQVVIDPEGDFITLADHYDHLAINVETQSEAALQAAGERARIHRASVILNLESLEAEGQLRAVGAFLNGLFEAPRAYWYPVLVVVDEAQLFAPTASGDTSDEARRLSLGAMTNLMCRGRKRGLAGIIATQRLAKLAKNVAAEASNFLMGRTFLDIDMARAADLLGMERRAAEAFRDLERGQFMALGPALSRRPKRITIGPVTTASRGAGPLLMPLEKPVVPVEELRDLILQDEPEFAPRPRREPPLPAPDLLAQLDAYADRRAHEDSEETISLQAQEIDASQIWELVCETTGDEKSYFNSLATLYQDFQMRARLHGYPRSILDMNAFRRMLGSVRSGISHTDSLSEEWQDILRRSEDLPEDLQAFYLLLAQAARIGAPCPSDEKLARLYGTHSLSRARRQLHYLEEREMIILRKEGTRRAVAIIGPAWQTTFD
ncbi:ATP-binding protein [Acetobacteraceae bacterium ESL0709]|nr:ATP-binding protein [Acetobacteraceae bacterium ESL0697]MDF7677618.1 ATP-binding protein [Acetobacteraceae bacterium ESL0709]